MREVFSLVMFFSDNIDSIDIIVNIVDRVSIVNAVNNVSTVPLLYRNQVMRSALQVRVNHPLVDNNVRVKSLYLKPVAAL